MGMVESDTSDEERLAQVADERKELPETVVPSRISARELVDHIVDSVELVERGHWRVHDSEGIYDDVAAQLYLEGYRLGRIRSTGSFGVTFDIHENYDVEDAERYLDTDK